MSITGKIQMGHKQIVATDQAPAAIGPYSQATVARFGYEKVIAVSGQLPINPDTKKIDSDDITQQTRQALENLLAIAKEGGAGADQVLKVEIFYTRPDDFGAINKVYEEFFPRDQQPPARQAVGVAFLPHPDAKVEISAWVLAGSRSE